MAPKGEIAYHEEPIASKEPGVARFCQDLFEEGIVGQMCGCGKRLEMSERVIRT